MPKVGLRLETCADTDFWQRTHYGLRADNGHVLGARFQADFTLSTHVRFHPVHQYDQAGLMVRVSSDCWLKTSVEYEPEGASRLGVVVTNGGFSDWSTQDVPATLREIHLRLRRTSGDYLVEGSQDGARWMQLRVAHLHEDEREAPLFAGLYACSPRGAGFVAEFSFLELASHA
jgi:regulation of enolase protein 1 (concanavalin A-like superfamily)